MDLSEYIADSARRAKLAEDLDTSPIYLWQLATGWRARKPSPQMAMRIEEATGTEVRKESLRPDIWPADDQHREAA